MKILLVCLLIAALAYINDFPGGPTGFATCLKIKGFGHKTKAQRIKRACRQRAF